MAIYKPNNFYPYHQEVDMESIDGNVFSCQVNTNGGLSSGARVKILSASDNIELYENIYQFKTNNEDFQMTENGMESVRQIVKNPYRNKDIVELPINPYEIFPIYKEEKDSSGNVTNKSYILYDVSFQSLCGKDFSYEQKKNMCPYNLYMIKKNNISYFKIIVEITSPDKIVSYKSIDLKDIRIETNTSKNNLFNIHFNNVDDFISCFEDIVETLEDPEHPEASNTNKENTCRFFITLKNGYDYLWNVRLYEHYFDENFDNGTFISDGYITGTTKNVFWYNQDANKDIMAYDSLVKKDNFIEVIADSENSDIFSEQILNDEKTTKGSFLKSVETENYDTLISKNTDGYLLSGKVDTLADGTKIADIVTSTEETEGSENTIGFNNYYTINNNDQIILSEKEDTWLYKSVGYSPVWSGRCYFDSNVVSYMNGEEYAKTDGWYFLNDVGINVSQDRTTFNFDLSCANIGNAVYYYIDKTHKTNEIFFICPDVRTHVIIKEIQSNGDAVDFGGQKLMFNGKEYVVRVLSPLPFNSNNYNFIYGKYTGYNNTYYAIKKIVLSMNFSESDSFSNILRYNKNDKPMAFVSGNDIQADITCFEKDDSTKFVYNSIVDIRNIFIPFNKTSIFKSLELADKVYSSYPFFPYYDDDDTNKKNKYKIKLSDNTSNGEKCKLSYLLKLNNCKKYKISGLHDVFPESYFSKASGSSNFKYTLTCKIYDKNNVDDYKALKTELVYCNDSISKATKQEFSISINDGSTELNIPFNYINPYMELEFELKKSEAYEGDNVVPFYIYDMNIKEGTIETDYIFLDEKTVDISEYIDNMYIEINGEKKQEEESTGDNDTSFKNITENNIQKIKKYDKINRTIILEDETYQAELLTLISKSESYSFTYNLFYKQREKITWVSKNLGFSQNINKIETENEFNINLKNNAVVHLYSNSDENTYNSFFGVQDTDLNVENIYVRFPGYKGKDSLNNELQDDGLYYKTISLDGTISYYEQTSIVSGTANYSEKTYKGVIKGPFYCSSQYYSDDSGTVSYWDDGETDSVKDTDTRIVGCPVSLYGTRVREEAFNVKIEKDNSGNALEVPYIKNKLFKVTSYNPDTGEFVLAGGLSREILSSDRYEIWKKEAIEGSDNEYDITEVISTYTRLYPKANEYDEKVKVSQNSKLISEGIKILNSNTNQIFIQPNVNFSSDNNVSPYLIIDSTESKLYFPYNSFLLNSNFDLKDITFEKLDNSQWLLNYTSSQKNDLIPGLTYKIYTDWADSSPSNYFYARDIGEIELKYGELTTVNNIKESGSFSVLDYNYLKENLYKFNEIQVGDNYVISGMNIYLLADIKNIKSQIKKYRYKIYNADMELLWDSTDIWDNIMEYEIKGISPNKIYYLTFECEDEYGYEYFYENSFYSQYDINKINTDFIKLTNLCYQNAVCVEIERDLFLKELNLEDINNVEIYRRSSTGKTIWIDSININIDKVYTGMGADEYKYGFVDYGVYNHEYYDYMFVFNIKEYKLDSFSNYEYVISIKSIKTNFDSWSIVNIVENQEKNVYEVTGELWSFRYNLETSDITNNTSVTTWNTLGKYGQLGIGERGYDSSGLTCLLGDVGEYTVFDGKKEIKKYGYHEKLTTSYSDSLSIEYNNPYSNNIDKYKKWKKFCRSLQLKLLKDISGNMWIVGIMENPTSNINTHSKEQMKTISFQWTEFMDCENLSIIGKLTSYDRKNELLNNAKMIFDEYWEVYSWNKDYTQYGLKKIKKNLNLNSLTIHGNVINDNTSAQGILYTWDSKEEKSLTPFKYQSNDLNEEYNEIKEYIFEPSLKYTANCVDYLFANNSYIESIDIVFNDNIQSAQYAFSGCENLTTENLTTENLTTKNGRIEINTSNYINTLGMLDGTCKNITITWNKFLTNETTDLLTYAELYEQYWNKENIILDCSQMAFNIDEWEKDIVYESGTDDDDEITYNRITYLSKYNGEKENIFIPKYYKDTDNQICKIILADDFKI